MDTLNAIVSKNIRKIRKEKQLNLDELASLSGVSRSMLAQIERGDANPTLSTLWKIANGMHIPFTVLIDHEKKPYDIVRMNEIDPVLENNGGVRNYSLFPDEDNRHFSVYCLQVDPGNKWDSEPHGLDTTEFVTVFQGELEVKLEDQIFLLKSGDSLYFQANVKHSYRNTGNDTVIFHNILYSKP